MPKKRGNNEGSITKRKDGRWEARVTVGRNPETGQLKRICLYGPTREKVAEKIAQTLSDKSRGCFIEPNKVRLGEWLDCWLEKYKRPAIRPRSFDAYLFLIRKYVKPAIGHITLKDLRPETLQGFYNEKRKAGLSPKTIKLIHTTIHGALEQAVKNQMVIHNVSKATTTPKLEKKEFRPLSREEVQALLDAVREDRHCAAIFLEFHTGLRRGELLALRWEDIDLEKGLLQVRRNLVRVENGNGDGPKTELIFQEPKTPASKRIIPISKEIIEVLKHHRSKQAEERLLLGHEYQDHNLVFCGVNGKPMAPSIFGDYFRRLLKRLDLPPIRLHDARHTFATLMLELGEHPKTVQTMLGHSNIAMTLDLYSHVSLELEKRAMERLSAALQEKASPSKARKG